MQHTTRNSSLLCLFSRALCSMGAIRSRQALESRAEAEEELFTRVPLSREENKRLKASRRAGLAGAGAMDDFADEVADLVEVARGSEGQGSGGRASSALTSIFAKQKVSALWVFGSESAAAQGSFAHWLNVCVGFQPICVTNTRQPLFLRQQNQQNPVDQPSDWDQLVWK